MRTGIRSQVAGERLASSAQPPRASSFFSHRPLSLRRPQHVTSTFFLDNPGALLEGLRCFPAACPLPLRLEGYGKPPTPQEINSGIKKIVLDVMAMLFRKHEVLTCKT